VFQVEHRPAGSVQAGPVHGAADARARQPHQPLGPAVGDDRAAHDDVAVHPEAVGVQAGKVAVGEDEPEQVSFAGRHGVGEVATAQREPGLPVDVGEVELAGDPGPGQVDGARAEVAVPAGQKVADDDGGDAVRPVSAVGQVRRRQPACTPVVGRAGRG
jgi:hypothetical protein